MNNIRATQKLNERELEAGIPLSASWHTDWSDTAYVYIGGLPYELSEGDIITIFSQFGEPVHVNLIRDKDTGKSKGFAFLKYEDQRSTNLAVDNLGGTTILGRTIRVDHVRYKPKEGELEELEGQGSGSRERGDNEEESERRSKRRRGKERGKTPSQGLIKEEIELQKLIQEHDEDDPMKEYLIREKKEEVELALQKLKEKNSSHYHRREGGNNRDRNRSHRHRSCSKERSRHRSRSKERRCRDRLSEKISDAREKGGEDRSGRGRGGDKGDRTGEGGEGGEGRGGGGERDRECDRRRERGREGDGRREKDRGQDRRHRGSERSSRKEGRQHEG